MRGVGSSSHREQLARSAPATTSPTLRGGLLLRPGVPRPRAGTSSPSGHVLHFQETLPEQQLWWRYTTVREFEGLLREHLRRFVLSLVAEPRVDPRRGRRHPRPRPARRETRGATRGARAW